MSDSFDVIMAAYTAAEPAQRDFDGVVELVKDKTVKDCADVADHESLAQLAR
jgi:hypothetical protein